LIDNFDLFEFDGFDYGSEDDAILTGRFE